jgi:hypothetical protein
MGIFLHVVALVSLTNGFWPHAVAIADGGRASAVLKWILSLDAMQFVGLTTLVLVAAADAISIYRLWRGSGKAAGTDTNYGPTVPRMGLHAISAERAIGREISERQDHGVVVRAYHDLIETDSDSFETDALPSFAGSSKEEAPVSAILRHALWAILGLAGIALGGVILGFSHSLAELLQTWPDEITMGAVVIGMALIVSAAILSSFLMLTARLNAVSGMASDAEEVRRHVERAKAHLAVIARRHDTLRTSG